MAMHTSYHTHTTFSDGLCSISDYISAAVDLGLDELGISDHYTLMPDKEIEWSMPVNGIATYFEALKAACEEAGDKLALKFGLEADFIPETAAELSEILHSYEFDYVIGSVHFVDGFPIDDKADLWDALSEVERNDMIRAYWARVAGMAKSGMFDIAGHLDLYKKFGHRPTIDISSDISNALDAIAASKMAAELNTSGLYKACEEAYPSAEIIAKCKLLDIPMLVTSDAHSPDNLTRGFEQGFNALKAAGYANMAVFAKRKMSFTKL